MTTRRNGIVIDEDGPWVAACYLHTDPTFIGTEHGFHQRGTLCGLPEDAIVVVRHPFYGTGNADGTRSVVDGSAEVNVPIYADPAQGFLVYRDGVFTPFPDGDAPDSRPAY